MPGVAAEQLYDIKSGAQLMKAVVEQLTTEDMIALAAYAGARAP